MRVRWAGERVRGWWVGGWGSVRWCAVVNVRQHEETPSDTTATTAARPATGEADEDAAVTIQRVRAWKGRQAPKCASSCRRASVPSPMVAAPLPSITATTVAEPPPTGVISKKCEPATATTTSRVSLIADSCLASRSVVLRRRSPPVAQAAIARRVCGWWWGGGGDQNSPGRSAPSSCHPCPS